MKGRKAVLITDSTVFELHGKTLVKEIGSLPVHLVKEGEAGKTRMSKEKIEDFLFTHNLAKSDLLIALGGGALIDTAGFAASCYKRGISYLTLPTTLLAMVDSCIGGKTAINTPYGKNTLGAIYFPVETISYLPFINTLSSLAISDGLAEAVKYGFIHDRKVLDLCTYYIKTLDAKLLVETCQKIKMDIVKGDVLDSGRRQLLNFGHTVAHAIEHVHGPTISHGQAVMIGMVVEAKISQLLINGAPTLISDLQLALKTLHMKLPTLSFKDPHLYLEAMLNDKKNQTAGVVHMTLLKHCARPLIKEGRYSHGVDFETIKKALHFMEETLCQKEHSNGLCG